MSRLVWIHYPFATEAQGRSGLVEVSDAAADAMIADGNAQEWFGAHANDLRPIQHQPDDPPKSFRVTAFSAANPSVLTLSGVDVLKLTAGDQVALTADIASGTAASRALVNAINSGAVAMVDATHITVAGLNLLGQNVAGLLAWGTIEVEAVADAPATAE